jgi:hypothetical protein
MKVKNLIEALQTFDPEMEVCTFFPINPVEIHPTEVIQHKTTYKSPETNQFLTFPRKKGGEVLRVFVKP